MNKTGKPAIKTILGDKARIILDGICDAALVIENKTGNVVYANRSAGEILGTDPDKIPGTACGAILRPLGWENPANMGPADSRANGACEMIRPDGTRTPVSHAMIPLASRGKDYTVVICADLSDQIASETQLLRANEKLKSWVVDVEQRNREITLLQELSNLLQRSRSLEEAARVVAASMVKIFPRSSGSLIFLKGEKDAGATMSSWGNHPLDPEAFDREACTVLRTGLPIRFASDAPGDACSCIGKSPARAYLCLPLEYHGEILGALHVRFDKPAETFAGAAEEPLPEHIFRLVETTAGHLSLSAANMRLKGSLFEQAIRDPLTGLFNRRYLEESIAREVARAQRTKKPLGIIMADIDHFKIFNDRYGHAAGDEVLKTVSHCLQSSVRTSDIVCRYGGEEFIAVLPDANLPNTVMRAEQIRVRISSIPMILEGRNLGRVTLSLGVAEYPVNGLQPEAFIKEADRALYRAKKEGRNRVAAATSGADDIAV